MFYRIRRYLKPNFSNHPLNYIFTILLGIGAYLFASLSQANIDPDSFQPENGYRWSFSVGATRFGSTPYEAFRNAGCVGGDHRGSLIITSVSPNQVSFQYFRCNGTAYFSQSAFRHVCETCIYEPINNCPLSGTPVNVVNRLNWGDSGLDTPITIGQSRSINGCEVVPSYSDVACNWDETMQCKVITGYEFSGHPSTQQQPIPDDDVLETAPSLDPVGVLPNVSDTTVDRNFESWPDGSTTETVVTTTTENRGAGQTRNETETVLTVTYSNGITRTETIIETTLTNADGSKTVTTEKTTTFTQNPINTITITKPNTINGSQTQPKQSSQTTTTTENFDPNGNKTGSSTTSSGSGDQVGGGSGDGEGDGCEDCDPPNYEESGSWWQSNYPDGIQGILDQHKDALLQSSGIAQMTDAGISSGAAFPIWTMPAWSIGPLSISAKTIDVDPRVFPFMKAALLFIAAVVCRRLVFGG